MLQSTILKLANEYAPDTIAIRHHLHANPELSYQEFETSAFIQKQLASLDIPFQVMAGTGVVAMIEGKKSSDRVVALRADIDALPIQEANKVDYKSTRDGIMHACGHDVHTSCLLGAARILKQLEPEINGSIKLIFQPGEERNPGGASILIKEGVLENPAPECIFGMHVNPQLEIGKFSFRGGQVMASADEIYITITAQGGHAAAPHLTPDTILIASYLITALQQVISRNNNPLSPSVLSICSIQGGHTTNVIPSEVKMMGTFRALNEEWRYKAHELIRKISHSVVEGMGASLDLHIDVGYPSVYNNEALNEQARKQAELLFGKESIETTEMRMGAEDFGYYSQKIPGCFFRLGVANASKGITSGVHTPTFNIDESAIEKGMAMMAWLGLNGGF